MVKLFRMVNIQRREPCLGYFVKCIFKLGLCSETYELISFKVGMWLNCTVWYQFEWPWLSLKGTVLWENSELVQSVIKWHGVALCFEQLLLSYLFGWLSSSKVVFFFNIKQCICEITYVVGMNHRTTRITDSMYRWERYRVRGQLTQPTQPPNTVSPKAGLWVGLHWPGRMRALSPSALPKATPPQPPSTNRTAALDHASMDLTHLTQDPRLTVPAPHQRWNVKCCRPSSPGLRPLITVPYWRLHRTRSVCETLAFITLYKAFITLHT